MSLTAVIFAGLAGLMAVALWRRPQAITLILAAAFVAGVAAASLLPTTARPLSVIVLDLVVVIAMGRLVRVHRSARALIVLWIGTFKIAFEIVAALTGLHQPLRAATINGAFVVQVLIAGGMANGLLAWLGNRLDGLRARLHRMPGGR